MLSFQFISLACKSDKLSNVNKFLERMDLKIDITQLSVIAKMFNFQ